MITTNKVASLAIAGIFSSDKSFLNERQHLLQPVSGQTSVALLHAVRQVPLTAAFIYKRQNRFRERFAALHRAEALDPRNRRVLGYLSNTFRWVRNWPEALQAHSRAFHEALLAVAGNPGSKQQALEVARKEIEIQLSSVPYDGPDRPSFDLALLYAFLGRKEEATGQAEHAIEREPGILEQNDGLAALAMVYAQTGEPEKAIALIEHLLTVPVDLQRGAVYNMTLTDLKWRWQWDPLRSHPRFQKILSGPEPKTVY